MDAFENQKDHMTNSVQAVETKALPVASGQATSLLQAITAAASNPATDIEKMERLFKMHQEMVKSEAEASFNAAMARAQSNIVPVANNASNQQTSSRYAKLAAINKAITPIYTAEGLSISFDTGDAPRPDLQRTIAIVSHAAGHSRQYHIDLPLDSVGAKGNVNKTAVHATGSTSSYSRRYLVCMIFNVTTEDDTDGNNTARGLTEKQVDEFEKQIKAADSADALGKVWTGIVAACRESGDTEAYNDFKGKVTVRGNEFKVAA